MNDIDFLEQQAVDAAINADWSTAVGLNDQIIAIDKKNVDAWLRNGFAYIQLRELEKAKDCYNKALRLQPKHQVALENLEKIQVLEEKGNPKLKQTTSKLDPNLFLDVPGKTRTVSLVTLGQKNHLAQLVAGQAVELKLKKRKVEVRTTSGDYLGCLPDDLSKRLIFFMKAKSEYSAYVKEAGPTRVAVFIKEEVKGKRIAHYTSFPSNIQTNLENMNADDIHEGAAEEESEHEGDEWEKLASDLSDAEEKEELIQVHQEEEDHEE